MGWLARLLIPIFRYLAPYFITEFFTWLKWQETQFQERRRQAKEKSQKEKINELYKESDKAVMDASPDQLSAMGNDLLKKLGSDPDDKKE